MVLVSNSLSVVWGWYLFWIFCVVMFLVRFEVYSNCKFICWEKLSNVFCKLFVGIEKLDMVVECCFLVMMLLI